MRVGIVMHPVGDSAKGLEQYIYETTQALLTAPSDTLSFTVFVRGNPDVTGLNPSVTIVHLPDFFFANLFLIGWYFKTDRFIFFTESAPLFLWKKSVIVFFDAAYYYFGSKTFLGRLRTSVLVWWRTRMLRNVRHVVAISEASKRDLEMIFCVPRAQNTVIYSGFKRDMHTASQKLYMHPRPFFLYVGPMKERKNVLGIVAAFHLFRKKTHHPHDLIIVGRKSKGAYESEVMKCIEDSPYRDSIILKDAVDDDELYRMYRSAHALVFPSLLEGFGLPVLEALSVGTVVITSSTTSTKEVVGDAGFLSEPTDYDSIQRAMECVASNTYNANEFRQRAQTQVSRFSWERSAQAWHRALSQM